MDNPWVNQAHKYLEELNDFDQVVVEPELQQDDKKKDIKPDMDLANIENALLTVAESIKYLADTYAEVNKPPEPTEEEEEVGSLKTVVPWRRPITGDYIRLTGQGNSMSRKHAGEIVRVTRDYPRVCWESLDGSAQDTDGITNAESRFTVME